MAKCYQDIASELNRFELINVEYSPRARVPGKKVPKNTPYDSLLIQLNAAVLEGKEGSLLSPEMKALAQNIHALNNLREVLRDFVSKPQPLYELIDPLTGVDANQNSWNQIQWEEEAQRIQDILTLLLENPKENVQSEQQKSPFAYMADKMEFILEKILPKGDESHVMLSEEQQKTILAKKEKKAKALAMLDRLGVKMRIVGELPEKKAVTRSIPSLGLWDSFLNFFGVKTRKTKAREYLVGEVARMMNKAEERTNDLLLAKEDTRQAIMAEMEESVSKLKQAQNEARQNASKIVQSKESIERIRNQVLIVVETLDVKVFKKTSAEMDGILLSVRGDMKKSHSEIQKIQALRNATIKIENENRELQVDINSKIDAIKEDSGISTDSLTDAQIDDILSADFVTDESEVSNVESQYAALAKDLDSLSRIKAIHEKSIEDTLKRAEKIRSKIKNFKPEITLHNSGEEVTRAVELSKAVESAERVYTRSMEALHKVNAAMVKISVKTAQLVTASKEAFLMEHIEQLRQLTNHNKLSLEDLELNRAQIFSRLAELNSKLSDVPVVEGFYQEEDVFKTWVEARGLTQKIDAIFDAQKRSAERSCDLQQKIRKLELEAQGLQEDIHKALNLSLSEYAAGFYQEHIEDEKPENITVDIKIARVQECAARQELLANKMAEHKARNEALAKKVQEIEGVQQALIKEFETAKTAKNELSRMLAESELIAVQAENQKRVADTGLSEAAEAIMHIERLDKTDQSEPEEDAVMMISSTISSGLSQVSAVISEFFDENPVISEKDLAYQEAKEAEKAVANVQTKLDSIDDLVDELLSFQAQGSEAFRQGAKAQKLTGLMEKATKVLATLHDNKGTYEWALIQAIVPAVTVMQRAVNQSIQKMCESSDLSAIQRGLPRVNLLSIEALQVLKDQIKRMKSEVSGEAIEGARKWLQLQQFSGTDIHILQRERAWLSANIKLWGMPDAILRTEADRSKAIYAMAQIDEVIGMHQVSTEIIAVAEGLDSALKAVETQLQGLKDKMKKIEVLAEPSLVLKGAAYGIWTEEKKNHSALFQSSVPEAQPKANLVRRTLGAVKMAVSAVSVFVMDASAWFGTLIESGGVGFL